MDGGVFLRSTAFKRSLVYFENWIVWFPMTALLFPCFIFVYIMAMMILGGGQEDYFHEANI